MDKDNNMRIIKGILIAMSVMILMASTVSAYVPDQYKNKPIMTDYDVYQVSLKHMDQPWAIDNLRQLMINYTNSGKCRSCLDDKMEFYRNLLMQKIKKIQKLPGR